MKTKVPRKGQGPRVLLVEDSAADAALVGHLLKSDSNDEAVRLMHARTLLEATTVLDAMSFDVVLADLGLPDCSGVDTVKALLRHSQEAALVVLTGSDDLELGVQALREGAQDFLCKGSVDPQALRMSLRFAVTRKLTATHDGERQALALRALEAIGECVIVTNANGEVTFINAVAERLLNVSQEAATGHHVEEVMQLTTDSIEETVAHPIRVALERGAPANAHEVMLLHIAESQTADIEQVTSLIRGAQGDVVGAVMAFRDVSERRAMLSRFAYEAKHDHLTGLANRRCFDEELSTLVADAMISRRKHVLMVIDLDQFKQVNDAAGHVAGDHFLAQIARTLAELSRRTDLLARLGGDEFALLLHGCGAARALRIADAMLEAVRGARFEWEGRAFATSASIGVFEINSSTRSAEAALRNADQACKTAKEQGKDRAIVFGACAVPALSGKPVA